MKQNKALERVTCVEAEKKTSQQNQSSVISLDTKNFVKAIEREREEEAKIRMLSKENTLK